MCKTGSLTIWGSSHDSTSFLHFNNCAVERTVDPEPTNEHKSSCLNLWASPFLLRPLYSSISHGETNSPYFSISSLVSHLRILSHGAIRIGFLVTSSTYSIIQSMSYQFILIRLNVPSLLPALVFRDNSHCSWYQLPVPLGVDITIQLPPCINVLLPPAHITSICDINAASSIMFNDAELDLKTSGADVNDDILDPLLHPAVCSFQILGSLFLPFHIYCIHFGRCSYANLTFLSKKFIASLSVLETIRTVLLLWNIANHKA